MSEKLEKKLRILVLALVAIIAVVIIVSLNTHSKYDQNDMLAEQGKLPVYVNPPEQTEGNMPDGYVDTKNNNSGDASQPNLKEPENQVVDRSKYKELSYSEVYKNCEKKSSTYIKTTTLTIYSVLKTSSTVTYNAADDQGNYHSIIDKSGSEVLFNKTDKIIVYGIPNGLAKLNNSSTPQLLAHLIEKSE